MRLKPKLKVQESDCGRLTYKERKGTKILRYFPNKSRLDCEEVVVNSKKCLLYLLN